MQVEQPKPDKVKIRRRLHIIGVFADIMQWGGLICLFYYDAKLAGIILCILLGFALRTYGHVAKTVRNELTKLINTKPNDKERISRTNGRKA